MKLPSDFEIKTMVSSMWRKHLNLEHKNISLCLASSMKVEATPVFQEYVHKRLKAMVKSRELGRMRFLPGRPLYWPG